MSLQYNEEEKSKFITDLTLLYVLLCQIEFFLKDFPPNSERALVTQESWKFTYRSVRRQYAHIDKDLLDAWDEEAKTKATNSCSTLPESLPPKTETVAKSKTKKTSKPLQRKKSSKKDESFSDKIASMINDIEEHGKDEFILARLPLYEWIGRALLIAFENRQPNFNLIGEIAQHLLVVLAPISTYGGIIASRILAKAKRNSKDVIMFSSTTSFASILVQIDESEKLVSAEGNETDDRAVKAALKKLRWGYVSLNEGSPGQKDLLEDKITLVDAAPDQKLQDFLAPPYAGGHLKNIVGTVARCSIVAYVCANMPLRIAYLDLTDSSILDRARELHRLVHDGEELDLGAFVQVFMEDTISPALVSGDNRELAIQVTCELCKCLTNTVSETRSDAILPFWNNGQGNDDQGTSSKEKVNYCGQKEDQDARNICTKTFFNLFLEERIENALVNEYDMPEDLFGANGLGVTLPLFAQSNIRLCCNFPKMKFFGGEVKVNKEAIKKVVDKISFERNLVFENKEQLLSLQRLFELSVGD